MSSNLALLINCNDIIEEVFSFQEYGDSSADALQTNWQQFIGSTIQEAMSLDSLRKHAYVKGKRYAVKKICLGNKTMVILSHDLFVRDLMEKTLDHVVEGIQIFDEHGYLIYGNPTSQELEGYELEEKKGKHLLDIYNLSEEYSTALSVIRTKKPVINRCDRFVTKDEKEVITVNSGYPINIGDLNAGACVFESDISLIDGIKSKKFDLESFIKEEDSVTDTINYTFKDIVHKSGTMKECIKNAKKIAITDMNVLITGETGTGKELFAQSIHAYSRRKDKPFVDINCSAIPSNLIESIFFGTEKGAFTGSVSKEGLFELAEGGTLFLDEVNSMGYDMQVKLLRVIQEKKYQRVGASKYSNCDVRIIAAANEQIEAMVNNGKLREDFFYRISAAHLNILPLRVRKEDIDALVKFILDRNKNHPARKIALRPEVWELFYNYRWPGNVRELENVIGYSVQQLEDHESIDIKHIPQYLKEQGVRLQINDSDNYLQDNSASTLNKQLQYYERCIIQKALEEAEGNITQAATLLGISRQNLQYRLRKMNK